MYNCRIGLVDCNLHLFDRILTSLIMVIALIQLCTWVYKLWHSHKQYQAQGGQNNVR